MKNFKLAFVGCGKVANHYKNLIKQNPIKNLEISGVCDSNLETAKIFSEKFSKKYFNDLDKMLSGIEIDLAIVCSPSGMHYEQSKKIIENGNNLIVEKPLTLTVHQSEALKEAALKKNVILNVAFQNRLNPAIQILKKNFEKKRFGKVVTATVRLRWCRKQEYYNDAWRKLYADLKMNPAKYGVVDNGKRPRSKKKKAAEKKKKVGKLKLVVKKKKSAGVMPADVEEMRFVDGSMIEEKDMRICMEKTCGNKVMCFEYGGKIWKESRKSFEYNKDYELVDACKKKFGLNEIGMERVKSNFKIEKIDKKVSSWIGNWKKVMIEDGEDQVVFCLMRKIGDGKNVSESGNKKKLLENKKVAFEIGKIALFRGIFRVTDFNLRNILTDADGSLVSIDEGDIGKRKGIFGGREKWLKKYLTPDVMKEIYEDVVNEKKEKAAFICSLMEKFGYSKEMIGSVMGWYDTLEDSLKEEGYM